tara:strand:+ start:2863 stop:3177 length:315 start_codon:yes stop_codon:yes gene_type:complete
MKSKDLVITAIISIMGTYIMVVLNEPTPYIRPEAYSGNTDNLYQLKSEDYTYSSSYEEEPKQSNKTIQYEIPDRDLNPNYRLDRYIQDYLEDNPDIIEDYLNDY